MLYELFNVVGLAGAAQQVGAGLPLAHPEVGPAQRQLTVAPALDRPIHPQQTGQLLLRRRPPQGQASIAAELAGATCPGKALA